MGATETMGGQHRRMYGFEIRKSQTVAQDRDTWWKIVYNILRPMTLELRKQKIAILISLWKTDGHTISFPAIITWYVVNKQRAIIN